MWWYLRKLEDTEAYILYAYGCETRECDGLYRYDKQSEELVCEKLASGDTEGSAENFSVHVWRVITKEGAPDTRMVAIG